MHIKVKLTFLAQVLILLSAHTLEKRTPIGTTREDDEERELDNGQDHSNSVRDLKGACSVMSVVIYL